MNAHSFITDVLLGVTVLSCWVGVFGMLRMREPMQAMHYITLPATIGIIALTAGVVSESGFGSTAFKTAMIAMVLLAINSVVTHATARAFRTRQLGHWEPRDGDPLQFVPKEHAQEESGR